MIILRKRGASFCAMQKRQSALSYANAASCSTICQSYSVPGGGTPCGDKCIMYCVGK